jgi:hypothetical protein
MHNEEKSMTTNNELFTSRARNDVYDRAREAQEVAEEATKIVFEQENPYMQVISAAVFVGAIVLGIMGVTDDK